MVVEAGAEPGRLAFCCTRCRNSLIKPVEVVDSLVQSVEVQSKEFFKELGKFLTCCAYNRHRAEIPYSRVPNKRVESNNCPSMEFLQKHNHLGSNKRPVY